MANFRVGQVLEVVQAKGHTRTMTTSILKRWPLRGLALASALALILTGSPAFATGTQGLPDSGLTPGAINTAVTQADIKTTICVPGWTKTARPPVAFTNALKSKELKSGYNVNGNLNPGAYEEDHLVPLEIGGNPRSTLNLWPEPRGGGRGAAIKDKFENRVHALVCAGKMSLSDARQIFETDWETGYARIIGALPAMVVSTSKPTASKHKPASQKTVATTKAPRAGSFCKNDGATGVSAKGTPLTCKASATDSRLRWRS